MESSKNALERITEAAGRLKDRKEKASAAELTEAEKKLLVEAEGYVKKFEEAMEDDFNTADALAAVFELVKFANTNVTEESSARRQERQRILQEQMRFVMNSLQRESFLRIHVKE